MRRALWPFLSLAAGLLGNAGLAAEFAMADDANRSTAAPAIGGNPSSAESVDAAGAAGSCRLVRSATATAETGAAAIPHAVDIERSDPRLGGLMLRYGKQGSEAVVVVVEPFPPHARPQITLSTRAARELEIKVADGGAPIGGVVANRAYPRHSNRSTPNVPKIGKFLRDRAFAEILWSTPHKRPKKNISAKQNISAT